MLKEKPNLISDIFFSITNRWYYYCLFFLCSCQSFNTTYSPVTDVKYLQSIRKIDSLTLLIQDGDIITRTGNDFTSETLRKFNHRDKTFSHCGIASIENDTIFIYHAIGGDFNPDQCLKRETLQTFLDPNSNTTAGIFRFSMDSTAEASLKLYMQQCFRNKLKYDMDFRLDTDDKMYCTEFVAKSLVAAKINNITFTHSFISNFEYISTDDIMLHPHCKKISVAVFR